MHLLPIIRVTGTTASNELAKSLKAGAHDFVRNPYEYKSYKDSLQFNQFIIFPNVASSNMINGIILGRA